MSAVIQNSYTGNGSTTNYSFTFPYLKSTDVQVQVDATVTTAWQFANATTVQFNTAPANGAKIKILRETNVDSLAATFYAGSAIKSEDLNDNYTQNLYKTQEVGQRFFSNTGGTMTGDLTMAEDTSLIFEGATDDNFETTLSVADPTADRTITLPNVTGTVVTTGDTASITTTMIGDDQVTMGKLGSGALPTDITVASANIVNDTIVNADVNSSAAIDGTKINPAFGSQNITTTGTAATGAHTVTGNIAVSGTVDGRDVAADGTKLDGIETGATADQDAAEIRTLVENATDSNVFTDADHTKLNGIDTGATDDQTASEIKTLIASSPLDASHLAANSVTTSKIADAELTTLAGMPSGTASKLADSTALTADIADLNQIDGLTKQTTISDSDASFPTSGAVVDYVAAQIAPLGGLEVIANEVSFPNTQPASGVVISISDTGGVVVDGSGVSTTGRTVGGSTVTINGFPTSLQSKTMADDLGLMVSSTGSGQVYNYHKLLAKEADVEQLSNDINDFAARYRVGSSNPTSSLDAGDLFFNTSTSKLLVYNATNTAWEEAQSIGNFYISTLSPAFDGSTQDFTITNAPTNAEQIILSINGVIQKPNAGTSTPSEGFALSGSTVKLAAAPASGDDYFAVVIGSTVNVGTPSNNTVSTAILQNGSVTTDKIGDDQVTAAKLASNAVVSDSIVDGSIVNADINASAAIAGTKIAPDFGSQNIVTTGSITGADLEIDSGTLSVDATNDRVGIGTTSPSVLLDLESTVPTIRLTDSDATGTPESEIRGGGGDLVFSADRDDEKSSTIIGFDVDGSEKMRIDSTGNIGIGTTSPSRKFHVSSGNDNIAALFESTDAECQIRIKDNDSSEGIIAVTAGAFAFENTTTGSLVNITNDGKVGIGGTPLEPLDIILNTTSRRLLFRHTNSVNTIQSANASSNNEAFALAGDNIRLYTGSSGAGSEAVRIDSGGKVGIGTTSPSAFLEVISASSGRSWTPQSSTELVVERNGNCFLSLVGTTTANCMINFSDADDENVGAIDYDHANDSLRFRVNDGTRMVISSNGDIGGAGGGDNIHDASDERLKENMIELTDGLNKINQLKPISYNYKAGWNTDTEGRTKYGFGAQTTEKVDKVLVELFSDEDVTLNGETISKPLRVNEKFIIPMLVKAVQELSVKNTALETKVAALEAA